MTAARRYVRRLSDVLDRREREAPGRVRPRRVEGRETDGRLRFVSLDGTCVLSGEIGAEGTGDVITLPTGPLYNRGTTGIAGTRLARETATLHVERLEPDLYYPGQSYSVAVIGRGFTEGTLVEFLRADSQQINPDIDLLGLTYVSAELLQVEITVDPTADIQLALPIAYDDPKHVS